MTLINGATILPPSEYGAKERAGEPIVFGPTQTDGNYTALLGVLPPGELAPPLHIHPHTDEAFYIADGEVTFQLGNTITQAPAGTFVFVPLGVVHTAWNAGAQPVYGLIVISPGGAQHVFEPVVEL
jgi:mannose-6-phosphate isomerase-like protein (cupin superfamily)